MKMYQAIIAFIVFLFGALYLDYIAVALVVMVLAFHFQLHNAIILVLVLVSLIIYFIMNQIRIKGIYIFRVLASLMIGFFWGYAITEMFQGDTTWRIVNTILSIIIVLAVRLSRGSLLDD